MLRMTQLWSSRKCTGAAAFVRAFSSGSDPTVFTSLLLFGQKLPSALPKLQCERGSLPAPTEPVSEHVQGTQVAKAPKWPRRCSSFSGSSCSPASSGSADSSLLTSGCWYTHFEIHSFHSAFCLQRGSCACGGCAATTQRDPLNSHTRMSLFTRDTSCLSARHPTGGCDPMMWRS